MVIAWVGVALLVPLVMWLLRRWHLRASTSLDRHIEQALLMGNRPCECGKPDRITRERWTHTQRCCAPAREMIP